MSEPARFSVTQAHRLYVGPPELSLSEVARRFNCDRATLARRFAIAGLSLREKTHHTVRREIPDGMDDAVRELLSMVISKNIPWQDLDDVVRTWMYRPPEVGPHVTVLRRNLQLLGFDLAVVPYVDESDQPEPFVAPAFASGRTYA